MTKKPITRLRDDLMEAASSRRADSYEMINIRPGSKIAAMIELLAELRGVPIASMLTDSLSDQLAAYAAADRGRLSVVLDVTADLLAEDEHPSEQCAVGRLKDQGILKIETEYPTMSSRLTSLTFGRKKQNQGDPAPEDGL